MRHVLCEDSTTEVQETLKPVIQFLVATLQPSKVFMVRHSAMAEMVGPLYFDLLIVMPSSSASFVEFEPILNIASLRNKRVYCSLYNEGAVMEQLRAGHPFFALNFTPDAMLYDAKGTVYPTVSPEQAALTRKRAKETFLKGFAKARRFYVCAVNEFNEGENEMALFLLHQATELVCRSITKSLIGHEEKVHELKVQKGQIRRLAPELFCMLEEDKGLVDTLERGYVDARYNFNFKVEESMLPLLLEKVKGFQDKALEIVEERVQ